MSNVYGPTIWGLDIYSLRGALNLMELYFTKICGQFSRSKNMKSPNIKKMIAIAYLKKINFISEQTSEYLITYRISKNCR